MSAPLTKAPEAAPPAKSQAEMFQEAAARNGLSLINLMAGLGAGPYFVAISASHMIAYSLAELARTDKPGATQLADELSVGFVDLMDRLGMMKGEADGAQAAE